jgi:uncharacterized cupin superfamily protein
MTADPSVKPIAKVVSFQDPLPEPHRYRPQADRILSGDPAQAATNLFQSSDGRFNSGIWEAQRGKWRVVFNESEFCHLLSGVIVVTGDDGSQRIFRAGDAFVPALAAPGKSSSQQKSSTLIMSEGRVLRRGLPRQPSSLPRGP